MVFGHCMAKSSVCISQTNELGIKLFTEHTNHYVLSFFYSKYSTLFRRTKKTKGNSFLNMVLHQVCSITNNNFYCVGWAQAVSQSETFTTVTTMLAFVIWSNRYIMNGCYPVKKLHLKKCIILACMRIK